MSSVDSPITPEAEAELDRVLQDICYEHWDCSEPNCMQKKVNNKAKQVLIRLLVRERVDELKSVRLNSEVTLKGGVFIEDRIAHLESLLQEDNPPIW